MYVELRTSGNFLFKTSNKRIKKEDTLVIRETKRPRDIKKNLGVNFDF